MSNIGLFLVGCFVTLLVAGAMGILIWGAILDGRYNDEEAAARAVPVPPKREVQARTLDPLDAA